MAGASYASSATSPRSEGCGSPCYARTRGGAEWGGVCRAALCLWQVRRVLVTQGKELLVALFVSLVMVLLCGTLVYYIEGRREVTSAGPSPFTSIPESIFWAAQALSGNYPFFPQSDVGKLVSGVMGFIGIGLYALPAGIIRLPPIPLHTRDQTSLCRPPNPDPNLDPVLPPDPVPIPILIPSRSRSWSTSDLIPLPI